MAVSAPELHLFVLWQKARFAEDRILADLRRECEVVFTQVMRFEGDAARAYLRFYGPSLPDAGRKIRACGGGAFRIAVVRDPRPDYRKVDGRSQAILSNAHTVELKYKYRKWAGGHHRVHGTDTSAEFARDVFMLTGHAAAEWEAGVPAGEIRPALPVSGWTAMSDFSPFKPGAPQPVAMPEISNRRVFLRDKYINDEFAEGELCGRPCIVKKSAKAVWSIGNEYRLSARMHAAAPECVPCPIAWHLADDRKSAFLATAKVAGPSLTELIAGGVSDAQADSFAADVLRLADALKATGIVHRDLFSDNLLLDADGHLKAIDWQLAVDRANYREDPWVARHWKFRYVVFGVNRELGLGVWNDCLALADVLRRLPQTAAVKSAIERLVAEADEMTFACPPDRVTRFKLRLYGLSLRVQMLLRGRGHRKYAQLERRWRTACERWEKEK